MDVWRPLLPRGAAAALLHGLILPRLAAAVEAWEPTREPTPIHAWLHPWLPYLSTELTGLYPTIRCVYAFALYMSSARACVFMYLHACVICMVL